MALTACYISDAALANLVCASLHEDPYGVAQGDIPKVLEAFVLYLMELEKLSRTLMASVEGEGQALERADMMNQMELQIESIEGGTFLTPRDTRCSSPWLSIADYVSATLCLQQC